MRWTVFSGLCALALLVSFVCACATQDYHPIAEPQLNQMGINYIRHNSAIANITGPISNVTLLSGETSMERNFFRSRKDRHIERRLYRVSGSKTEITVAMELEDLPEGWVVTQLAAVDPSATGQLPVEIPLTR